MDHLLSKEKDVRKKTFSRGSEWKSCSVLRDLWGGRSKEWIVLWKLNNRRKTDRSFWKVVITKKKLSLLKIQFNSSHTKLENSLKWLNEKERTVDVLAYRAEEGRRKRRNASGSRTQATIRGYPNGGTRSRWRAWPSISQYITYEKKTQGIETS